MRDLKHLLLIALLAIASALPVDAMAQSDTTLPTTEDNTSDRVATMHAAPSTMPEVVIPAEEWKNHLQIGSGLPGWWPLIFFGFFTDESEIYVPSNNLSEELNSARIYEGEEFWVPSLTLEYGHKVKDWLSLGAKGYIGFQTQAGRHVGTNEVVYRQNHILTALFFNVRFDWLRREYLTLYSSIGVGAAVYIYDGRYSTWAEGMPMLDLTYIGLNVGRRFYGFAEIGGGLSGWARAGLGVRF